MFRECDITKAGFDPFCKIGKQWFLICAGKENDFNAMTCSWGFAGVMWNKNCIAPVIRPQRYTKKFLDAEEYFSVSFYPDEHKSALAFCGSNSGYDMPDKMKKCGLTPIMLDGVPCFEEAELILICRKLYRQDLVPEGFIDKSVAQLNYAQNDYHCAYIGEIVKAYEK